MSTFKIFVDISSTRFWAEVEKQGNILCNFYISIDDWVFPSLEWLDFPVIILGWWLEGYINSTKGEIVENSFMNGPYGFTSLISQPHIKLDFFQGTRTGNQKIASYSDISVKEYKRELLQVTDDLLNSLPQKSVLNKDIQNLIKLNQIIHQIYR